MAKVFNNIVKVGAIVTGAAAGIAIENLGLSVLANGTGAFSYPLDFDTSFKLAAGATSVFVPFILGSLLTQELVDNIENKERQRQQNCQSWGTRPYSVGPY